MIMNHYIHDYRGYDQVELETKANDYIETKLKEAGKEEIIRWDLCDVGANGIQLRAFIGKSSMMWVGAPSHTIKYDLSNLNEVMDEFLGYYIEHSKGYSKDSNPTRYQEESFAKWGCE